MSKAVLEIEVTGKVDDLQNKLNRAGKSTEDFTNKVKANSVALANVGRSGGQSIFNLTERLRELQSVAFTEKDRGKIKLYNSEIQSTQKQIKTLEGIGTSSFGNLSGGATKAFSALRTVANILPGVGIAGLLAFAAGPVIEYVTSLFTASEAVRKLAAENKKFSESLNKVQEAGTSTGLQLQSFVAIARDQTQSIETRNEALKSANKILGEHGQQLTLVNIATKGVTEEINKFTQATIQAALANKYSDRAADLLIQQKDAAKAYGKELSKLNELKKKVQSTTSLTGEERVTADFGRTAEQTKKVVLLADAYKGITKELNNVSSGLQDAQLQAAKLFGELGTKTKEDGSKGVLDKKEGETIASTLEKLRLKLAEINKEQSLLGVNADDYKRKISEVLSTATTLVTKFKVSPDSTLISKLLVGDGSNSIAGIESVATTRLKESIRRIRIGLKNELIAAPIDIPITTTESNYNDYTDQIKKGLELRLKALKIKFNPLDNAEGLQNQLDEYQKSFTAFAAGVNAQAQSLQTTIATALGDGIGQALAGGNIGNVFGNFFATILESLGKGIRDVGVKALLATKAILLVKKTIGKVPGIPAAIALIAVGALISAAAAKIKVPAFANGVNNFGGGVALVGERGPELVNLPRGSDVIPNHALGNSSLTGGPQEQILYGKISGEDIYIANQRFAARRGRIS